jgi:hypothetical protein
MAEAQPELVSVVEKKGQGQRGDDLKEVYEYFMVKACKDFVEFKRLFYHRKDENSERKDQTKDRMEKSYRFFELNYGAEDKKRFSLIRTSVLERMEKELCVVCKQPRKEMTLPCQFLKADCGHFIDGNCRDAMKGVKN